MRFTFNSFVTIFFCKSSNSLAQETPDLETINNSDLLFICSNIFTVLYFSNNSSLENKISIIPASLTFETRYLVFLNFLINNIKKIVTIIIMGVVVDHPYFFMQK